LRVVYAVAADARVVVHLAFIAYVLLGGLLTLRWPKSVWLHGAAVLWAVLVEWTGWICPLTPWEQTLRLRAGGEGYSGGFIEHYLLPILYPAGLTRGVQFVLGSAVLVINAAIYGAVYHRRRKSRPD